MKRMNFLILFFLFFMGCSSIDKDEIIKEREKDIYSSSLGKETYKEENKKSNIDDYYLEFKDIIEAHKGEEGFIKLKRQEDTYVIAINSEKDDDSYFKIGEVLDRGKEVCINLIKEKKSENKEGEDISSFTIIKLPKDFENVTVVTDEGTILKDISLKYNEKYPQP
ncbi:hypothetical protein [Clostridium sp.]|uniref:hypothetical protein n=1 Tax=Clostridium sp. TaxID=1506 RepID=UPI003463C642